MEYIEPKIEGSDECISIIYEPEHQTQMIHQVVDNSYYSQPIAITISNVESLYPVNEVNNPKKTLYSSEKIK